MKRTFVATFVAAVGAFPAVAEVVAPADVTFADGVVAQSLTGQPGNADAGLIWAMLPGLTCPRIPRAKFSVY